MVETYKTEHLNLPKAWKAFHISNDIYVTSCINNTGIVLTDNSLASIFEYLHSSAGTAKLDLKVHIPKLLDTITFPGHSTNL